MWDYIILGILAVVAALLGFFYYYGGDQFIECDFEFKSKKGEDMACTANSCDPPRKRYTDEELWPLLKPGMKIRRMGPMYEKVFIVRNLEGKIVHGECVEQDGHVTSNLEGKIVHGECVEQDGHVTSNSDANITKGCGKWSEILYDPSRDSTGIKDWSTSNCGGSLSLDDMKKMYEKVSTESTDYYFDPMNLHRSIACDWGFEPKFTNKPKRKKMGIIKKLLDPQTALIEEYGLDCEGDLNCEMVDEALLQIPEFKKAFVALCQEKKDEKKKAK